MHISEHLLGSVGGVLIARAADSSQPGIAKPAAADADRRQKGESFGRHARRELQRLRLSLRIVQPASRCLYENFATAPVKASSERRCFQESLTLSSQPDFVNTS